MRHGHTFFSGAWTCHLGTIVVHEKRRWTLVWGTITIALCAKLSKRALQAIDFFQFASQIFFGLIACVLSLLPCLIRFLCTNICCISFRLSYPPCFLGFIS